MSDLIGQCIRRTVAEAIPATAVDEILNSSKPLLIKFGADPSAADLHLGHAVVLNLLRRFQDAGHRVQFLIGDFTAMIGDPTGKSETRPILTREQILQNAATYQRQVFKILNPERTDVVFNSTWLDVLPSRELVQLSAKYTVARMLERDDFDKRFKGNVPISLHEFLYPLLQGYDSVVLNSDVEVGGTDQKFNLLMGRHLQKEWDASPQRVIMTPILEGLDGVQKMSKSLGNHVGLLDSASDMFGKIMSMPDSLIPRYYTFLTDASDDFITSLTRDLVAGVTHPKTAKEDLAERIVSRFHSSEAGAAARLEFNRVFSGGELPDEMPDLVIPGPENRLADLLVSAGAVVSKKEYSRLVNQGAISVDNVIISDPFYGLPFQSGMVIRVGKRRFYKTLIVS